jgi:hypothetical protein
MPITLDGIHGGLRFEMDQLEELVREVRQAGDAAAEAEVNYKVAYAQTRLRVRAEARERLTVDQVADKALAECEELLLNYKIAENRLTTTRESLHATTARMDGWRTLATSFRVAGG